MLNRITSKLAVASLVALAGTLMSIQASPVLAGEQPNILIMPEDPDRDTVPRGSRVSNRVLNAISSEMSQVGFKVYDETAVTLDVTRPGQVRRTDAALITIARRVQQVPIDVVVAYSIYASAQRNPNADIMDLRVRIPGRMIHVQTGKRLGNFEVAYGPADLPPLPPNCNRDCILEHIGNQAKKIAHDVGSVLATKLDQLSPRRPGAQTEIVTPPSTTVTPAPTPTIVATRPACAGLTTAYALAFNGFESHEVTRIEEYIVAFKGYDHHRPLRTQGRSAEYWYETCSDVARLNRNLRLMVEQMGLTGRISQRGNRFQVDKIAAVQPR